MQYAEALPALVTDNIGKAQLTVRIDSQEACGNLLFTGVDFYAEENNPDR
jgi:hypothetical protein